MVDVHEFILFGFRREFDDRAIQFQTMAELEPVMTALAGLKRRDWYFSERDGLWVTHLVWADEESIERAGAVIERNEHAISLFDRFELGSLVYAKFEAVGSALGTNPGG